jgi:hypothetical protein
MADTTATRRVAIVTGFDLGVQHARTAAAPPARAGIARAHQFRAGVRVDTHYSVGVT